MRKSLLLAIFSVILFGVAGTAVAHSVPEKTSHKSHGARSHKATRTTVRRHHRRRHAHPVHSTTGTPATPSVATTTSDAPSASASTVMMLGVSRVKGSTRHVRAGEAIAFRFTAKTSGTVTSADVYVSKSNAASEIWVGLYAADHHRPSTLMSFGAIGSPARKHWDRVSLSSAALVKGTRYYLALLGAGGALHYVDSTASACSSVRSRSTKLAAFPVTWGPAQSVDGCRVSAHVNGVAAAAADVPVSGTSPVGSSHPTMTTAGKAPTTSDKAPTTTTKAPTPSTTGDKPPVIRIKNPTSTTTTAAPVSPTKTTPTKPTPPKPTPTTPTKTTPTPTPPPAPTPPPVTSSENCFSLPGACGYPDPSYGNVGAQCSSLISFNPSNLPAGTYYNGSGLLEVESPNTTIANMSFPSNLTIYFAAGSSNSTLDNDCVLVDGGGASGSEAVDIAGGVTGTTIENSTIGGVNSSSGASDMAIVNDTNNSDTVAKNDEIINCGECVHGTWTLDDSYVDNNGRISGEHYEDWYFSDGTIDADHDVFLNPNPQTAEIFGNVNGGNGGSGDNHVTVTNSLLAGGGFMFYLDSSATSVGSATMNISGNRFARCLTDVSESPAGGEGCSINPNATSDSNASPYYSTPDSHGFYADGGFFGVTSGTFCSGAGQTWSDNVWDDNSAPVSCGS